MSSAVLVISIAAAVTEFSAGLGHEQVLVQRREFCNDGVLGFVLGERISCDLA
jgi:hypothetical protein